MIVRYNWFGAIILGVILLVLAYALPQPYPFALLETIFGWILVIVGIIVLLVGWVGPPRGRL